MCAHTPTRRYTHAHTSSFFLELFLCSSLVAYWTLSDLGKSSSDAISFFFSILFMGFWGENTQVVCRSLLQWTMFCQNSPPWPVHFGWSLRAWLIISLSYTKLWSPWWFWLAFCDCGFISGGCGIVVLVSSVCPLMDEINRLMQAFWCKGLAEGKTGSCSGGQAMLSKYLIQFSADG